jgi:hypothetical protein
MSFLDRIATANVCDFDQFLPFDALGARIGWVRRDLVHRFARYAPTLTVEADRLRLDSSLDRPARRTAAMDMVARDLARQGLTDPWRGESYPVGTRFGETLFEIERAAASLFGIRTYGVHLVGYIEGPDGLRIWVPRRAKNRPTFPGLLDNTVAGGQPAGLSLTDNLIKECHEEASIPPALALKARPVSAITYNMADRFGVKIEAIFVYDLALAPDFTPVNRDGEVEDFRLLPAAEVMASVEHGESFKFNCALVLLDFFVRHGLITPAHPDYLAIISGLRQ